MAQNRRKRNKRNHTTTATLDDFRLAIDVYLKNGVFRDMWARRKNDNCFFVLCDLDNSMTRKMAEVCIQRRDGDLEVGYLLSGALVRGMGDPSPGSEATRCALSPRIDALEVNIASFRSLNLRPFLVFRMPDSWIWKWAQDPNAAGESAPRDVIGDFGLRPAAVPVLGMSGLVTMETPVQI